MESPRDVRQNELDVTFFVPCLNEENNIVPTLETILAAVKQVGVSYEILVVDDHSKDSTVQKVETFSKSHADIGLRLIKNRRTMGLGYNYINGAFEGRGRYYMLINGDNAEPVASIVTILQQLGKADMIIPYFGNQEARGRLRRTISGTFTAVVNLFAGHRIRYYNGPVLHRRYNVMRWHPDTEGFAYQAECITRLLEQGVSYLEVQVPNVDRHSGITKAFSLKNCLSVTHSLLQIFLRRLRRVMFR